MDEYIKIMKEDYSLLGNVILQSRGNMALDKFAMKCGYSPRVFQGYIRNEKTRKHNDWRGVKRLADALQITVIRPAESQEIPYMHPLE